MKETIQHEKRAAAEKAVTFIEDGQTIGLGTGSTAKFAIEAIGKLVSEGYQVRGVPTSNQTAALATQCGIQIVSIDEIDAIDLTIDGTDEFDANLNLIKGGGGALLREKMVAQITKIQIIIADSTKRVEKLGAFKVPVEVVPLAANYGLKRIRALEAAGEIRTVEGADVKTDGGNLIIDADFGLLDDPYLVSKCLDEIEGVVCNGLFLDLTNLLIFAEGEEISVLKK